VFDRNVNAPVYVNQALADVVVPFMQNNFPHCDGTLQQDGARQHTARVTQQFLTQHNTNDNVLDWAAMSPDMSPIEHVWDELKRRVYARAQPPVNVNHEAVIEVWKNISQQLISNFVRSMRRCCIALINSNGGFTHY